MHILLHINIISKVIYALNIMVYSVYNVHIDSIWIWVHVLKYKTNVIYIIILLEHVLNAILLIILMIVMCVLHLGHSVWLAIVEETVWHAIKGIKWIMEYVWRLLLVVVVVVVVVIVCHHHHHHPLHYPLHPLLHHLLHLHLLL